MVFGAPTQLDEKLDRLVAATEAQANALAFIAESFRVAGQQHEAAMEAGQVNGAVGDEDLVVVEAEPSPFEQFIENMPDLIERVTNERTEELEASKRQALALEALVPLVTAMKCALVELSERSDD